jgi:H+/Cl- antiporter ClcA
MMWAISLILICVGGYVVVMNWFVVFQWMFAKKHSSWIPLVGGVIAALGVGLIPNTEARSYWWIPLILDWGSVPGLLHAVGCGLVHVLRKTRGKGLR